VDFVDDEPEIQQEAGEDVLDRRALRALALPLDEIGFAVTGEEDRLYARRWIL
jgi:hypothetical protein